MDGRHVDRTCWAEHTHSSHLDYQVAEKCSCKRGAETYIAIMTCSLSTLLTQTISPCHLMTTSSHADFLHKDTTNMTESYEKQPNFKASLTEMKSAKRGLKILHLVKHFLLNVPPLHSSDAKYIASSDENSHDHG